jgi:hypothetical protein
MYWLQDTTNVLIAGYNKCTDCRIIKIILILIIVFTWRYVFGKIDFFSVEAQFCFVNVLLVPGRGRGYHPPSRQLLSTDLVYLCIIMVRTQHTFIMLSWLEQKTQTKYKLKYIVTVVKKKTKKTVDIVFNACARHVSGKTFIMYNHTNQSRIIWKPNNF